MKNSIRGIAPILIILIVAGILALAGGGWWWWQNKNAKVESSNSVVNTYQTLPSNNPVVGTNTQAVSANNQPIDVDATTSMVFAKSIVPVDAQNTTFTLPDFPNLKFKIKTISKATGGVSLKNYYNANEKCIFYKYNPGNLPPGYCFDTLKEIEGVPPSVVTVVINVTNNSSEKVSTAYLKTKLFYERDDNGEKVTRLSQSWPNNFSNRQFPEFSDSDVYLSFLVPSDQDEFRLSFGNFSADPKFGYKDYIIDFKNKTFSEIPG